MKDKTIVQIYTVPEPFKNGGTYSTTTTTTGAIPPGDYVALKDYEALKLKLEQLLNLFGNVKSTLTDAGNTLLDLPEIDTDAECHRCGWVYQKDEENHGWFCGCAFYLGSTHPSQGY